MKKKFKVDPATLCVLTVTAALIIITLGAAYVFSNKNDGSVGGDESQTKEISFPEISNQPDRPDITVTYETNSYSDKYENNGVELINSNIVFPILNGGNEEATSKINAEIQAFALDTVRIKSYEKALSEDDYRIAIRDEMPFLPFDYNTLCESVFVKDGYVSVMFRKVKTLGMNEPDETIYSFCYDLASGERVDYSDFIGTDEPFAKDYIKSIISQHINNNPNHYYADALSTLSEAIDLNSFYLTITGVTLYFNPEIITPSVFGVSTFIIPYDKLGK